MIVPVVFGVMVVVIIAAVRIRSARRRRADRQPFITTWPDIELRQGYGGWNADAYDAGTGRDRTPPAIGRFRPDSGGSWAARPQPSRHRS